MNGPRTSPRGLAAISAATSRCASVIASGVSRGNLDCIVRIIRLVVADLLLGIHFAIAAFIVGGLVLVWAGAALGWRWVRNAWLRYLHLAAIAFVAAEALLGAACPLTVWEDLLRGGLRPESFIARWAHRLLYYQAPEWIFTAGYVAWTLATLITLRLVPPRRKAA